MKLRLLFNTAIAIVFAGTASAAIPDLSGNDSHWIEDKEQHCWAADPAPEPGETIAWSGACEGGLISGSGVLNWYINGRLVSRDEGNFKAGELSGHGRISMPDGSNYDGDFPGKGILTLPDGSKLPAQSKKEIAGWSIEEDRPTR